MAKEMLRLKKFHDDLVEMTGFKVFDIDMSKDEVDNNSSFFMYYEKGPISKAENNKDLLREFVLMFVTKDNSDIDEYSIIQKSNTWGLRFKNTSYDYGEMLNSQELVRVTTFFFQQVVICDG